MPEISMIPVVSQIDDDPNYITLVERLLRKIVYCDSPKEIYLIQIDNWFGNKWRRFSGKSLGALGVWMYNLTVPPFHPHRVLTEIHAELTNDENGEYQITQSRRLHDHRESGDNLNRKIDDISKSAVFVWYSGNTKKNDKASFMAYISTPKGAYSWYAAFERKIDWKFYQLDGLSKPQLALLLDDKGI